MSDLTDRLREVRAQATEGPWTHDDGRPWVWNDELCVASGWREQEARFVATFDPVLVAAMLDVIDAAEYRLAKDDTCWCPYPVDDETVCGSCRERESLARFREVAG